jgi:Cft2 family RNA processing exonuclease
VRRALRLFQRRPRGEWFEAGGPVRARFHNAGHLLGSNMVEVEIRDRAAPLRLLFSGDVGRYGAPVYVDPAPPPPCDYLVCESTYGDRDHPPLDQFDELAEVVLSAVERGGVLLVAAFAVGRAQQLIYLLRTLIDQKRVPKLPIHVDSPMAVDATHIYESFAEDLDFTPEERKRLGSAFGGENVRLSRTVEDSRRINAVAGPAVIISSAGMMTGGRILHHLARRISDRPATGRRREKASHARERLPRAGGHRAPLGAQRARRTKRIAALAGKTSRAAKNLSYARRAGRIGGAGRNAPHRARLGRGRAAPGTIVRAVTSAFVSPTVPPERPP